MERVIPMLALALLTRNLRQANSRIGLLLAGVALNSSVPQAVTPQQMSGLLTELMRAGQWLRELPRENDPALEQELSAYRENVLRLREMLPRIHRALLEERTRLESERARVELAAEWARRSRQTL
jgi:hypothetical protein